MSIALEHVSYIYSPGTAYEKHALKDVSFEIPQGQFVGIIGHTGSGKSTLIQHLDGLIRATGGELYFDGENIYKEGYSMKALRQQVGLVFQYPEYQLFAETVEKDVAFGLKNFRKDLDEADRSAAVRAALETVGLDYEEVCDKSPFELSGGQKRRVAIAGVIVTRPEVLILDEPAAGLDPLGKAELMQLLHSIHGDWCKTVIIVSHDMDEIAENCTRAAVFSEGKVVLEGTPAEIFRRAHELILLGLDIPVTAKCALMLKERGICLDTDFTCGDFADKVLALWRAKEGGNAQ